MTQDLQPYPDYKDAQLPWLEEVPAHWDMARIKHLLTGRNVRGFPAESPLAATQTKGVIRKDEYESRTVLALKDLDLLKLVEVGDFVISLRSFQGGIEYARHRGIISPAYTILFPRDETHHAYLAALFKSRAFIDALRLYVTGIRQGQNIDYERLSRSAIPIPPPLERDAIARFAGDANRKINRFIRNRQRLIAVLNEQKQAIINRAVTRGLDPDVPLKPSGVDWLGDIPAHWSGCRLRNIVSGVTSGSRDWSSYAAESGPLFIRIANLRRMSLDLRSDDVVRLNLPTTSERLRTRVLANDLLISITAYIGSIAVVPQNFEEAYVSQHVARCPLRDRSHNPRWIGYVLLSDVGQTHGRLSLYGGTKDGLSLDDVKNYPVLLPPRKEQDAIVEYVVQGIAATEEAIRKAEHEIDLIREYRTRLIADVVTGKVDVRHLAPAEDEIEALDDELIDEPIDVEADDLLEGDDDELLEDAEV